MGGMVIASILVIMTMETPSDKKKCMVYLDSHVIICVKCNCLCSYNNPILV
jgi:hypothetical protein